MKTITIITWNINSVRLRQGLVVRLLKKEAPDILCLQETKCPDEAFPSEVFKKAGYPHQAIRGEKGYNGVAILGRIPISDHQHLNWAKKEDCRHQFVKLKNGIGLHNFYIPAGGDIPDPKLNPKFAHKLTFLEEMKAWSKKQKATSQILVGDLNIAPLEDDVWSHKQLLKIVSHTPIETESLEAVQKAGKWHDAVRGKIPQGKLYSWWSYRAHDFRESDRGRRLDHIWLTSPLADKIEDAYILKEVRGWQRPSDHAPVVAKIRI